MIVSLGASSEGAALPWFNDAILTLLPVKAARGNIYQINVMNNAAATSYLQFFFMPAAKVVWGTTAPDWVIKIPTNAGSGFVQSIPLVVPIGGLNRTGGPGTGLAVAGATTWNGSTPASIGVSLLYI